jgi:integrase
MKPPKTFAWSSIPNLEIRGAGRWLHARIERNGAAWFRSLKIPADPAGLNAPLARASLEEFRRRLAWCFLWAEREAHRFPSRSVNDLVRAAMADPALQAGGEPSVALADFGSRELRRAASLGTLRKAWGDYSAAQVAGGDMTQNHANRAENSLLLILRRAGKSITDDAPLDAIHPDSIVAFERATLAAASKAGPLAVNRARNTVAATVRQARSLFSSGALAAPEYRAITLPPGVREFTTCKVRSGEIIPEKLPSLVVMEKLRRGRALLRRFAPQHWAALVLEQELGLRAGEVAAARWDWFIEVEKINGERTYEASIVIAADYGPKGSSRRIIMDTEQAAAWREVVAARAGKCDYVLGVSEESGRRAVVDRLGAWLRRIGLVGDKREKPNHKLRKLRASLLLASDDTHRAQREMGHASERTTKTHYQLAPRAVG